MFIGAWGFESSRLGDTRRAAIVRQPVAIPRCFTPWGPQPRSAVSGRAGACMDGLARDRPWSGRSHEFAVATRGGPRRHVDRDDGPQAATGGRFGISGSQWLRNSRRSWLSRRSEEHTSELQSRENLVCRLLLEKKK